MTDNAMFASFAAFQSLSAFGSAYSQAEALKSQGEYQQQVYQANARFADIEAADAIRRGDIAAATHMAKTKQLIGSQRVSLAAQGIKVDAGSAAQVQEDTRTMGELDAMTIRNNAWREAWGYRVQAADLSGRGEFANMAAKTEAKNTLLTGGMNALGYGLKAGYYAQSK